MRNIALIGKHIKSGKEFTIDKENKKENMKYQNS